MDERIVERTMADSMPVSLKDDELRLDEHPLTKPPRAVAVAAWVRYGETPVRIEGRAVAWTARAVAVEWKTPAGAVHRAWVWASAVTGV